MRWIVFKQIATNDYWEVIYVDVEADTSEEAIRKTAIDKSGDGRHMAFPSSDAIYYEVEIERIASVKLDEGKSMG